MGHILDSVFSNSPVAPPGVERVGGTHAEQTIETGEHVRVCQVELTGNRVSPAATLAQKVSMGANSMATDLSLNANIYVSDTDYYFELVASELKETAEGDALSYEPLLPGASLQVGKKYQIRVSLSKNPYKSLIPSEGANYRLTQLPFKLPKEVFVQLSPASQDQRVLDAIGIIAPSQGCLSLDDLTRSVDFVFTIQKDYGLDITLQLLYLSGPNAKFPYPATTLSLRLEGKEPLPPPPEILQLSAKAAPPSNSASLYVTEGSEGNLMLRGWLGQRSEGGLSLEVGEFEWADPEDCPDQAAYLQKLSDSFFDYSIERATALAKWFEKALDRLGEQCSILIYDEVSALIPWEMFKLTDGRYLGAHAFIVRWVEHQYGGDRTSLVADPKFEGRVSAFVHPLNVAAFAQAEMQQLLPSFHDDPDKFDDDLITGANQVGLVYLCYGGILKYGDEDESILTLNRYEPYDQDVLIRYNFSGGQINPRPVVFANAPYSGRVLKCGQKSCGLARATLKLIAGSYIGTFGPVDQSYAAKFALKLLTEAASEKGCKPAELLRQTRAEVIARVMDKKLTAAERLRARKEFSYPFMYVHYGHPQDWVKITRPEPLEAEGGDGNV